MDAETEGGARVGVGTPKWRRNCAGGTGKETDHNIRRQAGKHVAS